MLTSLYLSVIYCGCYSDDSYSSDDYEGMEDGF